MEVWVVAAAQQLKKLTRDKRKPLVEEDRTRERDLPSTSGHEDDNFAMLDSSANQSAISISSVRFLNSDDVSRDWEGRVALDFDARDLLPESSSREMGFLCGFRGNRSSLRSRGLMSKFMKPRSSLEIESLISQLCKEYSEVEEYTYTKLPLEKRTLRPFVVTDGSKIINGSSRGSFLTREVNWKPQKHVYAGEGASVLGVLRLPNIVTPGIQKKAKVRTEQQQVLRRKSCEMRNLDHNNALGIISSFMANKREMEKLNKLLKQSTNLVQDLQEELEMKDSLTVKELAMEDFDSRDLQNASYCDDAVQASSPEMKLGNSPGDSTEELCHQKPEEESMSQIEAELEAELERLESSINSSRLERKISNMAEEHPDFVTDVIVGELRAELFGKKIGTQPYADRDGSGSSTPQSARYPVDPKELSLRLHEVIQSRLEERINELEAALKSSQNTVLEYQNIPPMDIPIYGTRSPVVGDGPQSLDQPVVINLSGEALSAYNEAYEELNKLSDSDEEEPNNHQEMFHEHKQVIHPVQNGVLNRYVVHSTDGTPQTEISYVMGGDDDDDDVDKISDTDDEMERLLIRQIVEKARQGSPALLKAQRSLLLNYENEH